MEKEQICTFGPRQARFDAPRTRAWYRSHAADWCDCAGCRNMRRYFRRLPPEVGRFLEVLGVDPLHPAEAVHYGGRLLSPGVSEVASSAWYHVCGLLAEEGGNPASAACRDSHGEVWILTEGWEVTVQAQCDLLPDDFPRPCFQLELWFTLPWLLDAPNVYAGEGGAPSPEGAAEQ